MVTSQHKQYSSQFLRQVNKCSKTQYNFSHFWLRLEVILAETLDKHAPEIVREVMDRTKIPWYNDDIRDAIHKRRQLEQIWKRKGDADSYIDFYHQRRLVNNMLKSYEQEYYHANLHKAKGNQCRIYELCNNLLGRNKDLPLPPTTSPASVANEFNKPSDRKFCLTTQRI